MTTPAINADPGDWIIYTAGAARERDAFLGAPWQVRQAARDRRWWLVGAAEGRHACPVYRAESDQARLPDAWRGAADLRDLNTAVAEYVETRDTLKPRYQARVDGLLLP